MVQGGPSSQNGQRYLRHLKKIHILHSYGLSAEGAKAGSKKRKRSTILPFSMVQSFFFVLFFSLCSNLSIWPGRQFVPDGSRCYIPIFDGLVSSSSSWLFANSFVFLQGELDCKVLAANFADSAINLLLLGWEENEMGHCLCNPTLI